MKRGRGARKDVEGVWKALANSTRRAILDLLAEAPLTTGEVSTHFPHLSRFAVMQHLGVLTKAELVVVQRLGRERFNYINPLPIQQIYDRWVERHVQPWTEALVRLKDQLEDDASAKPA